MSVCHWLVCQMHAKEVCDKIIEQLLKNGFTYQITRQDLEKAIMQVRGIIDERAIDNWIRALITWDYIKHIQKGIYQLNPTTCPQIFKTLKENPQTKLASG